MILTFAAIVILLIVFFIYYFFKILKKEKLKESKLIAERNAIFDAQQVKMDNHSKTIIDLVIENLDKDTIIKASNDSVRNKGTVLLKNEESLVEIPIIMYRTIKSGSKWQSGSRGIRLTPIRGISFSFGGTNGSITSSETVDIDMGWLILTNKRLIFNGENSDFSVVLSKLQGISIDDLTVKFDLTSRDVPDFNVIFANRPMAKYFTQMYSNPKTTCKELAEYIA